jgi:hypothetical protein
LIFVEDKGEGKVALCGLGLHTRCHGARLVGSLEAEAMALEGIQRADEAAVNACRNMRRVLVERDPGVFLGGGWREVGVEGRAENNLIGFSAYPPPISIHTMNTHCASSSIMLCCYLYLLTITSNLDQAASTSSGIST